MQNPHNNGNWVKFQWGIIQISWNKYVGMFKENTIKKYLKAHAVAKN